MWKQIKSLTSLGTPALKDKSLEARNIENVSIPKKSQQGRKTCHKSFKYDAITIANTNSMKKGLCELYYKRGLNIVHRKNNWRRWL